MRSEKGGRRYSLILSLIGLCFLLVFGKVLANPWNGAVLQAFWWDAWNENYPYDWYTYLAKLASRFRDLGIDGMWVPAPSNTRLQPSRTCCIRFIWDLAVLLQRFPLTGGEDDHDECHRIAFLSCAGARRVCI
jgi:hypothetical protein